MTYTQLIDRIAAGAGIEKTKVPALLAASLGVLGERLEHGLARQLAAALPHEAGELLLVGEPIGEFDIHTYYERVARRLGADAGIAMELAQVVLREVAALVDSDLQRRVRNSLGPGYEERFSPRSRMPSPVLPERHGTFGNHHTLAEGKPGGHHPLSESRPDNAHAHSVAREADPHGDTKLSGGRPGPDPHETLAEGKPGGKHPVSED